MSNYQKGLAFHTALVCSVELYLWVHPDVPLALPLWECEQFFRLICYITKGMSSHCLCSSILSVLAFTFISSSLRAVTPWLARTTFDGLCSLIFPCILTDSG